MRQRPQRPLVPGDSRIPNRAKHGMAAAALAVLLRKQQGRCALCRRDITGIGAANTDHDHDRARRHPHDPARACDLCRRSLLCRSCNLLLGYARDDPALLRAAASYLDFWASR